MYLSRIMSKIVSYREGPNDPASIQRIAIALFTIVSQRDLTSNSSLAFSLNPPGGARGVSLGLSAYLKLIKGSNEQ